MSIGEQFMQKGGALKNFSALRTENAPPCPKSRWGPNRVFGKTEDYGFLSVKKVKT